MLRSAIYAISADPITNGHIDVVKRALKVFDHLIVAIGINDQKKYTFDLERREKLTREALTPYGDSVTVKSFTGSLADFAYKHNVLTIIRGIRNSMDFGFEQIINDVNKTQHEGLDTVLLIADQSLSHVSSSAVKELMRIGGKNILEYVPMVVKCALEKAITNRFLVGVTGEIGAGKSYIVEELRKLALEGSTRHIILPFHNIDLDRLGHEILEKSKDPIDIEVRNQVAKYICPEARKSDGFIDTRTLGSVIFVNKKYLDRFNEITKEPLLLKMREVLRGKTGVVIINSALLAEADLAEFVNNNVVLVRASDGTRKSRLGKRGYTADQIGARMGAQLCAQEKKHIVECSIAKHSFGNLIDFDNDHENDVDAIRRLYTRICTLQQGSVT